jgi:hypothetical protein
MAALSKRALRVFAVLEAYRDGASGDVLDALLPFFEPILADLTGKILNPEAFAETVRSF